VYAVGLAADDITAFRFELLPEQLAGQPQLAPRDPADTAIAFTAAPAARL
jgi:hypothetical protein